MKINELITYLEEFAPLALQESYDNCGLQVGDRNAEIHSARVCIDLTDGVLQEAIDAGDELIIMHHPVIFGGLKRLTGEDHVQRLVSKAIKHDIALYAIHTNLDNVIEGVNGKLAEKLGVQVEKVLRPMADILRKLVVFVPKESADALRKALFDAGAGAIGNYDECSFNTSGTGTFRPGEGTDPSIGKQGEQERVKEERVEVIIPKWRMGKVLKAMVQAHPYEEVAHDIYPLANTMNSVGAGAIGALQQPMAEQEFLQHIKDQLGLKLVRHSEKLGHPITRVAICGGSGSFLIGDALRAGADAFITGDLKYHQFQEPDGQMLLVDAGHYGTEQYTMELLQEKLGEKFAKFAIRFTEQDTNPIHYS